MPPLDPEVNRPPSAPFDFKHEIVMFPSPKEHKQNVEGIFIYLRKMKEKFISVHKLLPTLLKNNIFLLILANGQMKKFQ